MQIWIREAEFQEWRELCLTKVWTIAEKYCPHCEMLAATKYIADDFRVIDGKQCYWIEQTCECNPDSFYYTPDDIRPLPHTYRGFVPLQFIELSEYDNFTGSE